MTRRRWAWVEVDTDAIRTNVRRLRALIPGDCKFMAVVKADGYGHGANAVARAAIGAGADTLGVATVDEALEIAGAGLSAQVHLLSEPPPAAARELVQEGVIPTVYSLDVAHALSEAARRQGKAVAFHLKVDTGMNRAGIAAEDAAEFLLTMRGLPGLELGGLFTHFATAEVPGDWDFERQLGRFRSCLESLREAGFRPPIVHAANSAATILSPESHYSMVRCGISTYGLHPGDATRDKVELQPSMAVKARIVALREVGMGDGTSYGFTWRASGPTTVATIPIGYGDGLHRVLSDKVSFLVGGRECPQIGRICMDYSMIELPRGVTAGIGDEVVIVGNQGGSVRTLDELAQLAGTINYEMACAFGMRMERLHT